MWATPRHHNAPPLLVFRAEDNLSLAHLRPQYRAVMHSTEAMHPRDTASTCCFASSMYTTALWNNLQIKPRVSCIVYPQGPCFRRHGVRFF